MSPVTGLARKAGRILSSVYMGNLIPVTEMKNVQKAPKIPGQPKDPGNEFARENQNVKQRWRHVQ